MYAVGIDGAILESVRYDTPDAALGDAHAIFGIEVSEWQSCDEKLAEQWERLGPPVTGI